MSHSPHSPSGSKRWLACPGSVAFCAGAESPDTPYSIEGTFVHEIAAEALTERKNASDFIGQTKAYNYQDGQLHRCQFTESDARYLQKYLDLVRGLAVEHDADLRVETRVALSRAPAIRGTADAILVAEDRVIVVDLKWGQGHRVEAEGNTQLGIYGLAALDVIHPEDGVVLELVVCQPRLDSITSSELSPEESARLYDLIVDGYEATLKSDAKLVAGDHCTFCPKKNECPALHSKALAAARDFFPTGEVSTVVAPPSVSSMTDEQVARVLSVRGEIDAWLTQVQAEALRRAATGREISGFKVVERVGNRKWIDEAVAISTMRGAGINPFADPKVVSPAEAERRVGSKKTGQQLFGPLVTKDVIGHALVPVADKRPAITNFSSFKFDALESI